MTLHPKLNIGKSYVILRRKNFSTNKLVILIEKMVILKMSEEGANAATINESHIKKLQEKAEKMGYKNLLFFIDDLDMLLRPSGLLKSKNMKYFELENLITLLTNKEISLGQAPRMISMVSKYAERNEKLEKENSDLKQTNITIRSKYQTSLAQIKELKKQLENASTGVEMDSKIREENIRLSEENKYLKMTNESLEEELETSKKKLSEKTEKANVLEVENSQLELRIRDLQRELKELELELEEEKRREKGEDATISTIEEVIEELDELYDSVDDPFKKEFLAFIGLELNEILDKRKITKQKILNQLAIHAREIEKTFEPQIASLQQQVSAVPQTPPTPTKTETVEKKKEPPKEKEKKETKEKEDEEEEKEDRYVRPSEVLKEKGVKILKPSKTKEGEEKEEEEEAKPKWKKKKEAKKDRKPSPELVEVFDIFIKYLGAIKDTKSFNELCDRIIDELYEHIGSIGMTKVYKIKSGGVKRKKMLVDLLEKWKERLPDM
jgi:myosin heavy subunit